MNAPAAKASRATGYVRLAVTVELLVPPFDPRAVIHPGSVWRDPGGEVDCEAPLTALDELALGVHAAVTDRLDSIAPAGSWVAHHHARVIEVLPPDPPGTPEWF